MSFFSVLAKSGTATSTVTYFVYNDTGLMAELNEQGQMTKAYGFNPQAAQAGLWSTDPLWQAEVSNNSLSTTATSYHYLHTDHLGTPMLATDKAGQTTWKGISEAFGQTRVDNGSQITMNLRFPGQYWDQETQTHYNYFRDYRPQTGRYTQTDPIGLKGRINFYAYVSAKPISNIDSFGLKAQVCCRRIVLAAYHCFINEAKDDIPCENCPSQKRTLGLQGPGPVGTSTNGHGQKMINDPFNDPRESVCGPWVTDCKLNECLTAEFNAYPDPDPSNYRLLGPNSNTFAYTLASRCGVPSIPNQLWSPGWGNSPAGPPENDNHQPGWDSGN